MFSCPLYAQEDKKNVREVHCRFLSFGWDGKIASTLHLGSEGEEIPCLLTRRKFSDKVLCFAENNKISFLYPDSREPMVAVKIPAKVKDALLIFVKNPKVEMGKNAWRVLVIEDSQDTFPYGGSYVVNLHGQEVRFLIGEHRGLLKAGGFKVCDLPEKRTDFNMAPVIFQMKDKNEWEDVSNTSLRFLPSSRYLFVSYVDPTTGRPRLHSIKDLKPFPKRKTS